MNAVIQMFQLRYHDWVKALIQHLQLSMVSILLAILIAIPLAIFIMRISWIKEWVLQATGVFQTIPSLALLGLMIPFLGIGKVPTIVALVIYAVFPILQNTVTGFEQIDPILEEAGEAFGMSASEKLLNYQIPLAMPVIVAGVRTTTMMVIGTATLAALIGAGGMGTFILLGIDRNNAELIFIGAVSSALLAMAFNYVLKWISQLSLKKIGIAFVGFCFATLASYLITPMPLASTSRHLVIAGKLGPEPEILMNMYKILIESETDISVELKPNFGKTTFLYEAIKRGDIDIYPEFTGTVVSALLKTPLKLSNDPDLVYATAKKAILEQDDLVLLKPLLYQNTYALAVKKEFASKYELETISDLAKVSNFIKAGFSLEFNDRDDGMKGLKSLYHLNLDVATMEPSLHYNAILNEDVQVIEVFSTDSEIRQYDLKLLKDDKQLFPAYQGAPLMRKETLLKYPEVESALNRLAGKITEDEMANMNYLVKVEKQSAKDVAEMYLKEHKLIQ